MNLKKIKDPTFNYITVMLQIKIPSTIFKHFGDLIKHFLWIWKRNSLNVQT